MLFVTTPLTTAEAEKFFLYLKENQDVPEKYGGTGNLNALDPFSLVMKREPVLFQ